jgi:alanine racemase
MDRGYVYVNKTNYLHNIEVLKQLSDKELCLVVKANGYGHGIEWTVKTAMEAGIKWFAVAAISEAKKVRAQSDELRVLLLTEPSLGEIDNIEKYNIDLTVYNDFFIDGLAKSGKAFNTHIKIDTGMHRVGCEPEDFKNLYEKITSSKTINLAGICTHFPLADEEIEPTEESIELFKQTIKDVEANINDEVVLLGNSENNELKITVFDIAKWNKTIEWEILTNINERLERVEIE